ALRESADESAEPAAARTGGGERRELSRLAEPIHQVLARLAGSASLFGDDAHGVGRLAFFDGGRLAHDAAHAVARHDELREAHEALPTSDGEGLPHFETHARLRKQLFQL